MQQKSINLDETGVSGSGTVNASQRQRPLVQLVCSLHVLSGTTWCSSFIPRPIDLVICRLIGLCNFPPREWSEKVDNIEIVQMGDQWSMRIW